ncbi:hypothetical protein GUJ93_ZPchr0002g24561 [Zizania palustris]|uniref:Thioredoxin domain-containing protein n=1 Tax=Zizania palustris TaxID=103762 RepID=A0A8J5VAI5_ZIZPA|nr:hypothetical protein GUJ93_ZPchr0002g24561 [Zizania palustris]
MSMRSGSSSSGSGGGVVKPIETWTELRTCLREAKDKLVVLEFMAPWSEPSKAMEQPYKDVASEFANENVQFVALNFDKFEFLGRRLRVEAMPVFLMVRGFKVEDRIVTLTRDELRNKIREMLAPKPSSTGG